VLGAGLQFLVVDALAFFLAAGTPGIVPVATLVLALRELLVGPHEALLVDVVAIEVAILARLDWARRDGFSRAWTARLRRGRFDGCRRRGPPATRNQESEEQPSGHIPD
jgi:hypothetical protein